MVYVRMLITMFESLVNTEGFKTIYSRSPGQYMFESLVNTEGFKTYAKK